MKLHTRILIGMGAGIAAGALWPPIAAIEPVGRAFIRLISMLVAPLVLASLVVGACGLGDIRKLGRIGLKTFIYYLITTALAITIGLAIANLVRPGSGITAEVRERLLAGYEEQAGEKRTLAAEKSSLARMLLEMIPENPFAALARGDMLAIIVFALLFGVALAMIPRDRGEPVIRFFDGLNEVMMKLIGLVMELAPIGVFALIAAVVGKFGWQVLVTLVSYSLVVLAGLAVHLLVVYPLSAALLARRNPVAFFRAMLPAQLIAFSTSSSNATLPATLKCCIDGLRIPKDVAGFVLPLGATVNMDGTALYQGVAAVFIAEVYGIPLDFTAQATIVLTATLASIGAAGVPGAGTITLLLVLKSIGVPGEGIALILGVDRILDMCRTVVNITGDATCAAYIARSEGGRPTPIPQETVH